MGRSVGNSMIFSKKYFSKNRVENSIFEIVIFNKELLSTVSCKKHLVVKKERLSKWAHIDKKKRILSQPNKTPLCPSVCGWWYWSRDDRGVLSGIRGVLFYCDDMLYLTRIRVIEYHAVMKYIIIKVYSIFFHLKCCQNLCTS